MVYLVLRVAGVALLVILTVAIHGAGTMLAIGRQMRSHPEMGRGASMWLVNRAVPLSRLRSFAGPHCRDLLLGILAYLIIPFTHPAMMTRYGCGAVRAQA